MFKNNLKIIWRNFIRDKQFTSLNLLGLSTGLACTLLIYLWIADELNTDKYNAKDDHLYQVLTNSKNNNAIVTGEYTPGLLAKALKEEMPEVEYAATILPATWFPYNGAVSFGDKSLKAGGDYVSNDYFDVFSCIYTDGSKQNLFANKNAVAISEELAVKMFGSTQNNIGKFIKWDQGEFSGTYSISGIFKKNPANATRQFDLLFNFEKVLESRPNLFDFNNSDPNTYVIVKPGADINVLNTRMKDFVNRKVKQPTGSLFLTKYSEKYLHGNYENGIQSGGRITYVKLFSIIAIFILVIACINFMNLSTAKASRRLKEVGIKKVMGADRTSLIFQYINESMLMALVALIIAVFLIFLLLPVFNEVTGKQLRLLFDGRIVVAFVGITIVTGFLAGSYPALYLSRFNPVTVLKGTLKTSFGELWIRKGLVVFQFTLSVVFIAAVLIVYKQLSYIQSKNLGYNRENIIHFEIPLEMDSIKLSAAASFISELKNIPGVTNASSYYHNLTGHHGGISDFDWPGREPGKVVDFANLEVGDHFLETAGITIKDGRNFSSNNNAQKEIIFNEAAIKSMGLKDPVGKTIKFWGMEKQIVGVAGDFNFESLYQSVKPCFFQVYPVMPNVMVRISGDNQQTVIEKIQKKFSVFNPGVAFDYRFLDEDYKALYVAEQRVSILSRCFATLAIVISCLGLFGLAAFTAQKRKKEIGIRKVIGASTRSVAFLLSREFLLLVLIAMLIAFPLVWLSMNNWLNNFAYRISIGPDIFLLTGIFAIVLTLFTISFQAIKAAIAKPVNSLRME